MFQLKTHGTCVLPVSWIWKKDLDLQVAWQVGGPLANPGWLFFLAFLSWQELKTKNRLKEDTVDPPRRLMDISNLVLSRMLPSMFGRTESTYIGVWTKCSVWSVALFPSEFDPTRHAPMQ